MNIYKNGVLVDSFIPSYGNKKILVGIDSSKTNTGIAVGDEYGNVLDDYEISGAGKSTDVYDLCAFTRLQLGQLFKGAKIVRVGIEDIITKHEKGYKGLEVHQSRAKITAVFNNFMFFFEECFGVRPDRINNWTWKSSVLPEQYRSKDHDKGSRDWFNDLNNRWAGRKDDVTDAICVLMYLYKTTDIKHRYEIKETVPSNVPYNIALVPLSLDVSSNSLEFVIDNHDTLEHNIETIANRIEQGQVGNIVVDINSIPIDWIYSNSLKYFDTLTYDRVTKSIRILVERS